MIKKYDKKILNNMDMKMLEEENILIQEHFIKVKDKLVYHRLG